MSDVPPKRHYLYCITNILNGKKYIGQTNNPVRRWKRHKTDAQNPEYTIHLAMKKYGVDAFVFDIIVSGILLCACQLKQFGRCKICINDLEIDLIKQHQSHVSTGKGYNESFGGHSSPSEQTLARMSKSRKGKIPGNKGKSKIIWPQDQELLRLTNMHGITGYAKILGISESYLSFKLIQKGLKATPLPKISHFSGRLGSDVYNSKLDEKSVLEIVKLYNEGNHNQLQLANKFKVEQSTISSIILGKSWSHITNIKYQENNQDNRRSKLTKENVLQIIKLHQTKKYTRQQIAEKFNITGDMITGILSGKHWSYITNIQYNVNEKVKYDIQKLSNEQILEIVKLYETGKYTQKELAKSFKTDIKKISDIIKGIIHSDITKIEQPNHNNLSRKLTKIKVIAIIELNKTGKYTNKQLAKQFNVIEQSIFHVLSGRAWNHITKLPRPQTQHTGSKITLNNDQVLDIIKFHHMDGYDYTKLGKLYNVTDVTIRNILTGKTWNHLTKIDYVKPIIDCNAEKQIPLTNEHILEIVELYNTGNYSYKEVGKKFNRGRTFVENIIKGKRYNHITHIKKDPSTETSPSTEEEKEVSVEDNKKDPK